MTRLSNPDNKLGNYEVSVTNGILAITKAPLTITAADKEKEYAAANPVLTGTIVGIKNNDALSASYSTSAVNMSPVGTYDIEPAAVDSSPSKLGNYVVSLVNGTLIITNTGPAITNVNGTTYPVAARSGSVAVSVSFADPGILDSYSVTWAWGDGSKSEQTGVGISAGGSGQVSESHIYQSAGVYRVMVTVADSGGGSDTEAFEYAVVYDPGAGFVTGGGWINSPEGAYSADPGMVGKANFGFVAKYQKGANKPSGDTEFQFKAGNLNFKSTNYDWLVVAGAKAQYKGAGTINGTGNYGFMLSAIDGQVNVGGGVDKFRIKIWDKSDSDRVVYDNQVAADTSDTADPITSLGGGSIVIHSKDK